MIIVAPSNAYILEKAWLVGAELSVTVLFSVSVNISVNEEIADNELA